MLTSQGVNDLVKVAVSAWKGKVLKPENLLKLLPGFEQWAHESAGLQRNDPEIKRAKARVEVALHKVRHTNHWGVSLLVHLYNDGVCHIGVRWLAYQLAMLYYTNLRPAVLKQIANLAENEPPVPGHHALTDDPRCFNVWVRALEEAAEMLRYNRQ